MNFDDPRDLGLLQFGLGMLQASGPRPYRQTFGAGLAEGAQQGLNAYQKQKLLLEKLKSEALDRQLQQARLDEVKRANEERVAQSEFFRTLPEKLQPQTVSATGDYGPGEAPNVSITNANLPMLMLQSRIPGLQKVAIEMMARKDEPKLHNMSPGAQLRNSAGELIAQNTPPERQVQPTSPVGKLIADRDRLPIGHPDRRLYDEAIKKAGEFAPPQPTFMPYIVNGPDGPEVRVFGSRTGTLSDEPIATPPPKPLKDAPSVETRALAHNITVLDQIDEAIKAVEANPNAFGLQNLMPDEVNSRMDPAGVNARGRVANISSLKILERSGATVTAGEAPRIKPFVPSVLEKSGSILTKLRNMREEVVSTMEPVLAEYTEERGYKEPASAKAFRDRTQKKKQVDQRRVVGGKAYIHYLGDPKEDWYPEEKR